MSSPRIICPYTSERLRPETVRGLSLHAPAADYIRLDDDFAYGRLWIALWDRCEDVVIIEHDMVLTAATLPGLARCPHELCAERYWCHTRVLIATGVIRVRGELMRRHPTLAREAVATTDTTLPAGHWQRLDYQLYHQFARKGIAVHQHDSGVQHLHDMEPITSLLPAGLDIGAGLC